MRLKESSHDGVDVFALSGHVDLHYAPALRSLFKAKVESRCPVLVVDFTDVDFIDSTGLATLVEYRRDAGAYRGIICLTGLNPAVKSIFDIVQFGQVLPIFPTVDDAVAALKRGEIASSAADEAVV